ncbi:cation:proton antiporter [bacterium SCSIO 12741]|nr:cation:proton antiporter [bacterium SCSIO 12741]
MAGTSPYILIIVLSALVILSYVYGLIAKQTNIPSVLLLIVTGMGITLLIKYFELPFIDTNWIPILEILGIVGLVMIVLEAALDLELTKEKWPIIWKSFLVALLCLAATSFLFTLLFKLFFLAETRSAILFSIPLAIVSSAIVIPSVSNCREEIKEFLIYESTFSDILGIMVFYFVLEGFEAPPGTNLFLDITGNLILTIAISIISAYVLTIIFQNITSQVKLFLLIAVLLMLYSIGKMLHISSLLIILFFGLMINNHKLFFVRGLDKYVDHRRVIQTLKYFKIITLETAFVVRTFFFIVFGMSITLASLVNLEILIISLVFLGVIFIVRYVFFASVAKQFMIPSLFVSPRGLITILLFFAIPESFGIPLFDNGVLLYVILLSSGIMTLALITREKEEKLPGILKATSRMLKAGEKEGNPSDKTEGE